MTTYYGTCPRGRGDRVAILIRVEDDGSAVVVGSHVSSSEGWAEHDIGVWHYPERRDPSEDDTYEWLGAMTNDELRERIPGLFKPGEAT